MSQTTHRHKAPPPKPRPVSFFAHRGGAVIPAEENTHAAFKRALAMGAPGIELDVHYHNGAVKVTHYKNIAVRKETPRLEETLDFFDHTCAALARERPVVNIDLKNEGCGGAVASIIERFVPHKGWRYSDFIITAFTGKNFRGVRERFIELKKFRKKNRLVAIGIIGSRNKLEPYLRFIHAVQACSLNTKWKKGRFCREFVDEAHAHGIALYPWNVNTFDQIADALAHGADGVITDYCDVAAKVLREKKLAG